MMIQQEHKRVLFIILGIAVVLATLYFVTRNHEDASSLKKVVIAQYGDVFLYAPLYIAIDAGYFADAGLNVSLVSTGGDEKTWAAVISGNASFGVADPTFVAISDSRGMPGKVVASIVNGVPFWGITENPKIEYINKPEELKGYAVATFPAPSTAYTLQERMFKIGNIPSQIREGAFGTLLVMLKSGRADIALELEPNVSQAVIDGAHIVYSMQDVYGEFALTGLTTTQETITKKPDLVQNVVCAIQRALVCAHDDQEKALSIMQRRFPEIYKETAREAFRRLITKRIVPISTRTNPEAWDKAIELRLYTKDISSAKDMAFYVDNRFADSAQINCGKQ